MFTEITSKTNKFFKHVKSLGVKSYREKNNEFVIEGIKLVKDALNSSVKINAVAISDSFLKYENSDEILKLFLEQRIKVYKFNDQMFKEISYTQTPQGILGIAPIKWYSIQQLVHKNNAPFYVFCDGVQDPGNMGTIIRTADAAGADGVILSKGCVDVYNPKTVRSTMGSLFHMPIIKCEDTVETLLFLKQKRLHIISGYLATSTYYFDIDMKKGIVLL